MSIYISISCLYKDKELLNTIRTAKDNSSNPEDIHIGVVVIGDLEFKNIIDEAIEHFKYTNIKTKYMDFDDAVGIYAGRHAASEMYDDQDYFLQVDSHTFFLQNWDIDLVTRFKRALRITKNKKTVLTAVPGGYGFPDIVPEFVKDGTSPYLVKKIGNTWYWQDTGYSHFLPDEWLLPEEKSIPKFFDTSPLKISKKIANHVRRTGFAPAVKICAAFAFGNKYFAKNTGLDPSTFFWEEEILQSVNLIGDGFTLVHLGFLAPLSHHFLGATMSNSYRVSLIGGIFNFEVAAAIMEKNYLDYCNDEKNKEKIKKYQDYAKIDLIHGIQGEKKFPKKYINKKRIFLR